MKKALALVFALVLVISMNVTAFAQNVDTNKGGTATITITNASRGETYTVYKVFDATVTGSSNGSIAYMGSIPSFLTNYFEAVGTTGYVQRKASATDEDIIAALKANTSSLTNMGNAVSDGTSMVFEELPYGYYVVTSTQNNGAAVTVTSTNPNAMIQDKNTTVPLVPEDGKTVDDENVFIGQTLTYTLKFKTSNYEGAGSTAKQIVSYIITDTLPSYLSNVTVTGITIDNAAYTVNSTVPQFDSNNKITIPWVNGTQSLYRNGAEVVITYTAVVTDSAAIAGEGNTNTFTLTYKVTGDNIDHEPEQDTDTATVKTYAIALKKVNDEGAPLAGAIFELPFYVKTTPDANGAYIYGGTTSGAGLTNTLETPASGEIVIKGVEAATYSITETVAPNGYNKLTAPISVQAVETSATSTTVTKYIDANGNVTDTQTNVEVTYSNTNLAASTVIIVNKTGIELPSTGGIGTTIFYILGAILVIGAGVVLITRRRMNVQ